MKKILEQILLHNKCKIEEWFLRKQDLNSPIYSSVDIRNIGFKSSPVDTNLFPAGFNNLTESGNNKSSEDLKEFLKKYHPHAVNIAIFTELFTRHSGYWNHIKALVGLFASLKIEVRLLTSCDPATREEISRFAGIQIHQIFSKENRIITADNWKADLVVLNNDLTSGMPKEFIDSHTAITPQPRLGWHKRSKYKHFQSYNNLVGEFCLEFNIDPWLMKTYVDICHNISFREKKGFSLLGQKIDQMLYKIAEKYTKYDIKRKPYIFLKADNGSLGRGIICVHSANDLMLLNKKCRHSINTIKGNVVNENILLQEGVETIERYNDFSAENTIYLVGGKVVGGFTRYNTLKTNRENLNSKGIAIASCKEISFTEATLARLATLATIFE